MPELLQLQKKKVGLWHMHIMVLNLWNIYFMLNKHKNAVYTHVNSKIAYLNGKYQHWDLKNVVHIAEMSTLNCIFYINIGCFFFHFVHHYTLQ